MWFLLAATAVVLLKCILRVVSGESVELMTLDNNWPTALIRYPEGALRYFWKTQEHLGKIKTISPPPLLFDSILHQGSKYHAMFSQIALV